MDETDGDRTAQSPFGGDLTAAVRSLDNGSQPEQPTPSIDELVGPERTLEAEVQVVWAIQSAISAAIIGVIAGIAFTVFDPGGPWVGGAVFVAVTLIGIVFSVLRYRIWAYQVRRDSLYLRRGVLTRVNTVVPYVRIQHVDTRRGPLERVFGLATTVVYTAGSRGADVSIPGLTPERADDLQTRLKQLAIAAEGDDAV